MTAMFPDREAQDLLDRCTFAVRPTSGRGLGTGILVAPKRVLTCAHVVAGLEEVEIAEGADGEPLCTARVRKRGNPKGPDDLALLELSSSLGDREVMGFAAEERGQSFGAIGFPRGREQVLGRVLGPEPDVHGWLRIEADSRRSIEEGFSGGAVWALGEKVAVGLITHLGEEGVAYAIPTGQISKFWPELRLGGEGPRPRRGRLHGVPYPRSVRFVGRDVAMQRLRDLLDQGDAVSVSASIEGLAGIGKTELALQLVHRLAAEGAFAGGIYWFNAENPDLTSTWGTTIADALGLPAGAPPERAQQALRSVSGEGDSVLLVLDNVESWSRDTRPGPLPEGVHIRHLLTSRQRGLGGSGFRHLELGILGEPYASQLFHEVAGKDLTEAPGHDALLDHLGGHALALELAGSYLSEYPEETPASYLEALTRGEDPEAEVSELVRYERTVEQAFETLWVRLGEEVRQAWLLAACFEPELASPALADAVGLTAQSRRSLRRLHLIEADPEGRWRLHRLTRAFGRRVGSEEERGAAQLAFLEGCMKLSEGLDGVTGAMTYLPDKAHLDAALALAPGPLEDQDPRLADFRNRIALARLSAADYSGAEPLFRAALAADLESYGEDHPRVAIRLNNLAQLLKATNRLSEAEPLMRRALLIDEESYGADHPNVARDLNNLAVLLQATNRLSEAEPLMRRALLIDEESYGVDHPRVAIRLNNLAHLLQATNRLSEAEPLMRRALLIDEESYGVDHPNVARNLNNLAQLLEDTNRLSEAEPLMRRALLIDEESYGAGHPNVARDLNNLALLLQATNRLSEAEPLMRRALLIDEESYGADHPDVARDLNNLALLLKDTNRLSEAEPLMRRALLIDEASYGADHPRVAIRLNNLATLLQATNRLSEAEPLMRRALLIDEASYGADHPNVARDLNNLAQLLQATNRLSEAEPLMRRALRIVMASLGEGHPNSRGVEANLQSLLAAMEEEGPPAPRG